jgi:tRNA modification GTPase
MADLFLSGAGPVILVCGAVRPGISTAGIVDERVGEGRPGADRPSLRVSVETGEGLSELKDLLPALVYRGLAQDPGVSPVLTRGRQTAAARVALKEITAFEDALAGGVPAELAATHLRPAETALEELLGVISTEDVLDRLFREFCIGK